MKITQPMIDAAKAFMLKPVREHSKLGDPWVRALLQAAFVVAPYKQMPTREQIADVLESTPERIGDALDTIKMLAGIRTYVSLNRQREIPLKTLISQHEAEAR
jgi:hypothetical protein